MRQYFYIAEGTQLGPYSLEALRDIGLYRTSLVWYEGCDDWRTAETIIELSGYLRESPPPIPGKLHEAYIKRSDKKRRLEMEQEAIAILKEENRRKAEEEIAKEEARKLLASTYWFSRKTNEAKVRRVEELLQDEGILSEAISVYQQQGAWEFLRYADGLVSSEDDDS